MPNILVDYSAIRAVPVAPYKCIVTADEVSTCGYVVEEYVLGTTVLRCKVLTDNVDGSVNVVYANAAFVSRLPNSVVMLPPTHMRLRASPRECSDDKS